MLNLLSNLIAAALLSTTTTTDEPAKTKALSFDASAYVTINRQIRVAVEKSDAAPVVVLLRNANNEILFKEKLGKNTQKYALKLDVEALKDGQYELEVKSDEGSIRKQVKIASEPVQTTTRQIVLN
ncbi:hypothetical protein [Tellurirhabdus bombi]|uniref:hypothetical protein n=1 Tax=Tellurirhabdus bombi TaxID=2907205 RepID=UPI001F1C1C1F|nr:hypothetical protein [Tellurirhabdus bombi]